jgi:membrane associated rhomboid family serine protease
MMPLLETLNNYFLEHQERKFLIQAIGLVVLLNVMEEVFYLWWLTILVFAPVFVFWLLQIISIHQDKGFVQVLFENLTFIPSPYVERDTAYDVVPWVTYLLILINVFVFYLVTPALSAEQYNNLLFVPDDVTFLNVLISLFSNIFMHGSEWHLWINAAFLWAMGTVLERRLGHGWLFGLYLASGVVGGLLFLVTGCFAFGFMPSLLGASGAISGLMGVYAVRCYFKTMVFPFPVLGLLSLVIPIHLKVRMNALVVVGLFFWSDLSGGFDQLQGVETDQVAYWCHIGGLLTGVLLAYGMNVRQEALQERRLDTARTALSGRDYLGQDVGEDAIREFLQEDSANIEALLLLARKVTQYRKPDEGQDLYQKAIRELLKSDLGQAVSVFKEYFDKYWMPLEPSLQVRLAALVEKSGNIDLAIRSLEALLKQEGLDVQLRGKCLFHCARLCRKQGFVEAAERYEEAFGLNQGGT